MGSYLSEPVTEKISNDEFNDKLSCGASSMQGWRVSQEDAHNCLLDFDINTSFFAVYDGHGGHEVAQYCSQTLPNFIKNSTQYKEGKIKQALTDGFLEFDATIATREVVAVLQEIAGDKEATEETDDEENVNHLYEEAAMPIEQVIEKYTNLVNPAIKNLKKEGDKFPKSPFLKGKGEASSSGCSNSSEPSGSGVGSSSQMEAGSSGIGRNEPSSVESSVDDGVSSSSSSGSLNGAHKEKFEVEEKADLGKHEVNGTIPEIRIDSATPDQIETKETKAESDSNETPTQNGEISSADNGEVVPIKGKGKALVKTKGAKSPVKSPVKTRPKRTSKQLYKALLDFEQGESEDSEDEEDKTFEEPKGESSDEDESTNIVEGEGSEEESSYEEEEDEVEEEEIGDDDDEDLEFARNMKEEPGSDSGCTAVVALLRGTELFVANAGDSRCIVCRNGKAIEMSFDHKPEDEPERDRIVKAGGKVTADGRVNGGLNLSRAIGDHAYKQNKDLSDREQMITALPDVNTLTINPAEDEFMVLACDGIWNFMSSQEVVDFVRPRIKENREHLSSICEEMFDHCLAPNTMGDGTGCDNMTAIIVQFKNNILKRSASPEPVSSADSSSKRAKTDEGVSSSV